MKDQELVSEERHYNNLLYLRELIKIRIDDFVESKKEGDLVNEDAVIEDLENLEIIDNCLTKVYSTVKFFDNEK